MDRIFVDNETRAIIGPDETAARGIVVASPNCILLLDESDHIIFLNPRGGTVLGIADPTTLYGRAWEWFWPDSERAQVRRSTLLARTQASAEFNGLRPTETGEPRWWHVQIWKAPQGDALARLTVIMRDITELHRTQEALRDSERRHRMALAAFGGAAFEYDVRTGRMVRSGYRALIGEDQAGEQTPEWWDSRIHPDDLDAYLRARQAVRDGQTRRLDIRYRVRHADGSWRWIWHRGLTEPDADGTVGWFIGTIVDVTAEYRAQDVLRQSEARLRRLVDAMPVIAWTVGPDRRSTFLNRQLRDYLGPAHREPTDALAMIHAADRHSVLAGWRCVEEGGGDFQVEARVRRYDGMWRWHRVHLVSVQAPDAGLPAVLGAAVDIHDTRTAAEQIAVSEARWRLIAESVPGPVFETDAEGRNTYVNVFFQRFAGVPADALLGDGWVSLLHPEDRARTASLWQESVRTGAPYQAEYRLRAADGTYHWFLCRGLPQHGPDGRFVRWFGAATDISEIVAAREQAARLAEELEARVEARTRALTDAAHALSAEMRRREEAQAALLQAQRLEALGQLTAGVAHDFNNVLAAISGGYDLLARRLDDPELVRFIDHGRRAVDRARALIRQLLGFARRQDLRPTVIDTAELAGATRELVAHSLGADIGCEVAVEPGTWPILADRHQLEVALINLAVNARDAMPSGGRLRIVARNLPADAALPPGVAPGAYVSIAVQDTGAGMPPDVLARATEPFFTTKDSHGTGLGLATVQAFTTQSGGGLRIASEPGRGTTVELLLPRAGVAETACAGGSAARAGAESEAGTAPHCRGKTVLLIENDEQLRPVAAEYLDALGCTVVEAGNAETAYTLCHTLQRLDLVVSDVAMAGAYGPEIVERLRGEWPGLPVIYITGSAERDSLAGESVLEKPFSLGELGRAVAAKLGGRGAG